MKAIIPSVALVFVVAVTTSVSAAASEIEFRLVVNCAPGLRHFAGAKNGQEDLCVAPTVIVGDEDILTVKAVHDKYARRIEFTYDDAARAKMSAFTEENIGHRIALIANGKLLTAPIIMLPITGSSFEVEAPDETETAILKQFQNRTVAK